MKSFEAAASTTTGAAESADAAVDDLRVGVPLSQAVEAALRGYLTDLQGQPTCDLYQQVLAEVEEPLLRVILQEMAGNQCRAAEMLGLSRGTLRKKLKRHGLL